MSKRLCFLFRLLAFLGAAYGIGASVSVIVKNFVTAQRERGGNGGWVILAIALHLLFGIILLLSGVFLRFGKKRQPITLILLLITQLPMLLFIDLLVIFARSSFSFALEFLTYYWYPVAATILLLIVFLCDWIPRKTSPELSDKEAKK